MRVTTPPTKIDRLFLRIVENIADQYDHLFLWVPVALGVGIGFYFSYPYEPEHMLGLVLAGIFFILFGLSRRYANTHFQVAKTVLFFVFTFVALGFGVASWRTQAIKAPVLQKKYGPAWVEGRIVDVDRKENAIRYVLTDLSFEDQEQVDVIPEKIRVLVRNLTVQPRVGDVVRGTVILNPPSGPVLPHGFDFQRQAYFQQLGAVGFALSPLEIIQTSGKAPFFEKLRQDITGIVLSHIDNKEISSVVVAFMTGEKRAIPEDTLNDIRDSGLAHLLAISGLHVGFVAGIIFFFVRAVLAAFPYLALHWPLKKIAAVIAMMGAIAFMLIVGASVPTQRAVIMTGLVLTAVILDRTAISLRLVALAAIFVLLLSPESLLGLSFQLSFAAVVALVAFYDRLRPWMGILYRGAGITRKLLLYVLGMALTSFIAGLATAPFALEAFNRLALYGILANVLALPVMGTLVMPFVILSYLGMLIGVEAYPLMVVEWGIEIMVAVAHLVAGLDGSVWMLPRFQHWFIPVFSLGMIVVVLWQGRIGKLLGVFLSVVAMVGTLFVQLPHILITDDLKLMAVKDTANEYHFSTTRSMRFVSDAWARSAGLEEKQAWPETGQNEDGSLFCDQSACLYKMEGKTVSFIKENRAMAKDCSVSDMIITKGYYNYAYKQYGCEKDQLLDRGHLKEKGVTAITIQPSSRNTPFHIEHSNEIRGKRPWVR